MDKDPGQMNNLLAAGISSASTVAGLPLNKVVSRLDSLLFVLKSCKGEECREPWAALHPERHGHTSVLTLKDALSSEFDDFYENQQTRVRFEYCWNGYVPEAEGPMWETDGVLFRDGLPWHAWV